MGRQWFRLPVKLGSDVRLATVRLAAKLDPSRRRTSSAVIAVNETSTRSHGFVHLRSRAKPPIGAESLV